MPLPTFEIDISRIIKHANRRALEMFGFSPQDLDNGIHCLHMIIPEERERGEETIQRIFDGTLSEGVDFTGLRKDGSTFPISIYSGPIYNKGKLSGLRGIVIDITKQKLAEKALRESEGKYRALFETAKDAIFLSDENGRFVDVNQAACDSLGYTKEELLKLRNKDIDADPRGFEAFIKVRENLLPEVTFEVNQQRKDGTLLPVEINGSFFISQGKRTALAIARDISERKHAMEALEKAREELERQNIELKKLDKMKDGLVRDTSHELKTPVAKQAMQLELLRDLFEKNDLADGAIAILNVMEKSVKRQEAAILNILTLSRLETGGRKLKNEPVCLNKVLQKVIDDYQHVCDSLSIHLSMEPSEITVVSDKDLLWHVFSNLVNNAIKFRDRKKPSRIDISFDMKEKEAVVKIVDNGSGLTKKEKKKVFERFYQRSASNEGVGVGLTIAKMITEKLGGRISLESEGRGTGATALVTLPLPGPNQ